MSVLSPALLAAVGLVLLASAASHLRAPGALHRGLRSHGVLRPRAHRPVSLALGPVEAALGVAVLLAALTGAPPVTAYAASVPVAVLFLVLTLYLARVLKVTAGQVVPCACGLGEAPVSLTTVVRAGALAAMTVVGGATAAGWSVTSAPDAEVFVTVAAALVLALSAALLPAARAVPPADLRPGPARHPRSAS